MTKSPLNDYYTHARTDLVPFIPTQRNLAVLELGCGAGYTGKYLKEKGLAAEVIGVELNEQAAEVAHQHLDHVYVGNVDELELPTSRTFDLILCADIIEHLVDPWQTVERMMRHLRAGGHLITSTPNVRHWRVLFDLAVRGEWKYTDHGIMDRTHLRFFTRNSIVQLHQDLGLQVLEVGYTELSGKRKFLDRLTFSLVRDLLCGQHVVHSIKNTAASSPTSS